MAASAREVLKNFWQTDPLHRLFAPYELSASDKDFELDRLRLPREDLMTGVTTYSSQSMRKPDFANLTTPVPITTIMYLDVLAGGAVEHVAAKYGLSQHEAAERIEAARLCYERQVDMPGFPVHLL